jgi:hypothetical protein
VCRCTPEHGKFETEMGSRLHTSYPARVRRSSVPSSKNPQSVTTAVCSLAVQQTGRDHATFGSVATGRPMTVKIVGKGLEELADGIRRQVIPYIQEQHVSEFGPGGGKVR